MINVTKKKYMIWPILLCLVFLLFFIRSDLIETRSFKYAWDLGHIPLFTLIGYSLFLFIPDLQEKKILWQFCFLATAGLVIGGLIEYLQTIVNRQASVDDVIKDVFGIICAIPLFSKQFRRLSVNFRSGVYVLLICGLLLFSKSFFIAIWDECQAYRQFPVLAEFEYASELGRWTGNAKKEITREVSRNGQHSLKVTLQRKYYSGVELQHFVNDWNDYTALSLHVFNPRKERFKLTVSIFDTQHRVNQLRYRDRYTENYIVNPGWNKLNVMIDKLINSPKNRQMDISKIAGIRLFVVKPNKNDVFYIDSVSLEK